MPKLDQTRSYGTVYGHAHASFEQNNALFDAAGNPLSGDQLRSTIPDANEGSSPALSAEATFLLNTLVGGPILQTTVKRESEGVDLVWSDVLTAAAEMGILKFKAPKGNANMWRLPEEN